MSAEEIKLSNEIQAMTEKIQSASILFNEQYEKNPSSAIVNLIRYNMDIEQKLKDSIKKEMNFQSELEKYLAVTHNSAETTENSIHDYAPDQTAKSDT
jgi:FKBP-type peptidyl-prolyl cis-trans isomerase (trigger factor)